MKKTRIVIAGIGGVGGYFGGYLAKHYEHHSEVEINFMARGAHLEAIKSNGLKVVKGTESFIAKPYLATAEASEIGIADYILIATKSYDLDNVLDALTPCIDNKTILIPLLNGVDSFARIRQRFPNNTVIEACVYIVSRLTQPGVIENTGNIQKLYFGSADESLKARLNHLALIFQSANIEATLSDKILSVIWEKFIFISPTATATSYFNNSIGEILSDSVKTNVLKALIEELYQLIQLKQITLPDDIVALTLNKLRALPYPTTSSMHSDFKANKSYNELASLTAYVIEEARKYQRDMPTYKTLYTALNSYHTNYPSS